MISMIIDCIIGAVCIQGWCDHKQPCDGPQDCPRGERDDRTRNRHISYCINDICRPMPCR